MLEYDELQMETVISSGEYIKKVINGIDIITGFFKGGEIEKGLANCPALIEGLQWLVEAVTLTKDVLDENSANINEVQLELVVKSISETFDNKDHQLLESLLENQLKAVMKQWDEKYDEIMKKDIFTQYH